MFEIRYLSLVSSLRSFTAWVGTGVETGAEAGVEAVVKAGMAAGVVVCWLRRRCIECRLIVAAC